MLQIVSLNVGMVSKSITKLVMMVQTTQLDVTQPVRGLRKVIHAEQNSQLFAQLFVGMER